MKALFAFIGMAVAILALIEINERVKAKRKPEDCPQKKSGTENCPDCGLADVCSENKVKQTTQNRP